MYTYVDVETTGLNARRDRLRIIAIDGKAYDVWDGEQYHQAQLSLKVKRDNGYTFVAHNAQFDLDFIAEHMGINWTAPVYDTMVAFQLINAGRRITKKGRNGEIQIPKPANLATVAREVVGVELDKSFQKGRWDGVVDNRMLEYAAEDTTILEPIVRELNAGLKNAGLEGIFKLEMALLPALVDARRKGVRLDVPGAQKLINRLYKEAAWLEDELPIIEDVKPVEYSTSFGLFDTNPFIEMPKRRMNPKAPSDVSRYFNLPDAQEDTLREYCRQNPDDKEAQTVRDIKKLYKKASTVQKQLLNRVESDGRIHPWFNQSYVATGRMSSREPNLQNQDRKADVRGLFLPSDGHKFVISDYSQLELRLAAYFSRDKTMLEAYRSGRDLHDETQRRIFGDPETMSKDEAKKSRTLSKNINFGLVYGGGAGVLVRFAAKSDVYITEEDAVEFRNAFRALYPGLVKWQEVTGNTKPEYVYTYRGRRRYITPGEGYCTRINNIVQGSAADGMKLALVEIHRKGILPLLNVHDEVVIECQTMHAENVLTTVQNVMVDAMYRAVGMNARRPVVPIEVEAGIADSWAEK